MSQDLLHVSVELESVEEQLKGKSSIRKTEGVTIRELEKDRDMLKMKRDTLEAQLRDNRVLTMEVGNYILYCVLICARYVCPVIIFLYAQHITVYLFALCWSCRRSIPFSSFRKLWRH